MSVAAHSVKGQHESTRVLIFNGSVSPLQQKKQMYSFTLNTMWIYNDFACFNISKSVNLHKMSDIEEFGVALLKLGVLISPFAAIVLSNASALTWGIPGISVCVLCALWIFTISKAFDVDSLLTAYGLRTDIFFHCLTLLKTIQIVAPDILHITTYSFSLSWWMLPVGLNAAYLFGFERVWFDKLTVRHRPPPKDFASRPSILFAMLLSAWHVSRAVVYYMGSDADYGIPSTTLAYFTLAEAALGLVYMYVLNTFQMAEGDPMAGPGSTFLVYFGMTCAPTLVTGYPLSQLIVTFGGGALLFFIGLSTLGTKSDIEVMTGDGRVKVVGVLARFEEFSINIADSIRKSRKWMRIIYLILAAYLVFSFSSQDTWFTTTVSFPSSIKTIACGVDTLVNNEIKPFMQYTSGDPNDPAQEPITVALIGLQVAPFIAKVRSGIRTYMNSVHLYVTTACHGFVAVVGPHNNRMVLVSLLLPFYVCINIILQIFPRFEDRIDTYEFWSLAISLNVLMLTLCHVAADAEATVWLIGSGTSVARVYTDSGRSALVVQGLMVFVCMLLYWDILVDTHKHRVDVTRATVSEEAVALTTEDLAPSSSSSSSDVSATAVTSTCSSLVQSALNRIVSPATMLFVVGVILLVLACLLGFPISSIWLARDSDYTVSHPSWASMNYMDLATGAQKLESSITSAETRKVLFILLVLKTLADILGSIGSQRLCQSIFGSNVCLTVKLLDFSGLVGTLTDKLTTAANEAAVIIVNLFDATGTLPVSIKKLEGYIASALSLETMLNFDMLGIHLSTVTLPNIDTSIKIPGLDISYTFSWDLLVHWSWLSGLFFFVVFSFVVAVLMKEVCPVIGMISQTLESFLLAILFNLMMMGITGLQTLKSNHYEVVVTWQNTAWLYAAALAFIIAACVAEYERIEHAKATRLMKNASSVSAGPWELKIPDARGRFATWSQLHTPDGACDYNYDEDSGTSCILSRKQSNAMPKRVRRPEPFGYNQLENLITTHRDAQNHGRSVLKPLPFAGSR